MQHILQGQFGVPIAVWHADNHVPGPNRQKLLPVCHLQEEQHDEFRICGEVILVG